MILYRNKLDRWIILFIVILVVVLLRAPSLIEPFGEDSGANAYHARLILQGEPLYGTHHPAHHLPGVYYTYALAFLIFGDSTWSVKFILIPWTILTAYLIFLIGIKLEGKKTGLMAAIFYAILNSHILLKGNSGETELFANLPIAAAIFISIDLILSDGKNWKFVFVGILSAIAFLYKIVFLMPIVVAIFLIILFQWFQSTKLETWKNSIFRCIWIGIGFLIPISIVIIYFAQIGLLPRLTLIPSLGTGYINQLSQNFGIFFIILFPLLLLIFNNPIIVLFSLGGALHITKQFIRNMREYEQVVYIGSGLVLWFLLSIVTAGITRRAWPHYGIIVIPPLSILAAWEIVQIYQKIVGRRNKSKWKLSGLLLPGLLTLALIFSFINNYQYYYHSILYASGHETHDQFLLRDESSLDSTAFKMKTISSYIQENTTPEDYIYSWSDNAQIYYLADRRAPIDMIWPSYAEATGSYKRIFTPQTKYIIVGESIVATKPDWLSTELEKAYHLETTIADQDIYRRNEE